MSGSSELVAIVAMANNRVIGDGNSLIWHLSDDLKRVKALTMGRPLIMGRRTWDSIGRPLPGRASIVMTRDPGWVADGALRAGNLNEALTLSRDWIGSTTDARDEIILFGGGQIYSAGLPFTNRIEATIVDLDPDGGPRAALFPELDKADWHYDVLDVVPAIGDIPGYRYERFTRKAPVSL
tara:strand:+ start:37 stop:579 length:543 start_codon:yes stop_codon:yes gene_type:complete